MNAELRLDNHPCFSPTASGRFGRVHLPVAAGCNMQCNYCNRKHDCVNESRPGVTSTLLTPGQALEYLGQVLEAEPRISVVGIAGPGDAFASPTSTMKVLRMIRELYPHLMLCVASNGLNIRSYIDELADLHVSHVTLTVNAVDPDISAKIYAWARDRRKVYRGKDAAELLLERQLEAILKLKERGIIVKANTIIIPGINEDHVPEVARKMAELGVDLLNCMPMHPTAGTAFENVPEPAQDVVRSIQDQAREHIPQMLHCTRCRADAVGLLGEDRTAEMRGCLSACSRMPLNPEDDRAYVAVASMEGTLVNQHLGEARQFRIYAQTRQGYEVIDTRTAPPRGSGNRWKQLADKLFDCRSVLVNAVGEAPKQALNECGIEVIETCGFIDDCLGAVFQGNRPLPAPKSRGCCGIGPGGGC